MRLEAIRYSPGSLQILDQLQLPEHCRYEALDSVQQAGEAIRAMKVRGAPAIALVGCLSLAVELRAGAGGPGLAALVAFVQDQLRLLVAARPTAVNMARAARDLARVAAREAEQEGATEETVRERYGILDQSVHYAETTSPFFSLLRIPGSRRSAAMCRVQGPTCRTRSPSLRCVPQALELSPLQHHTSFMTPVLLGFAMRFCVLCPAFLSAGLFPSPLPVKPNLSGSCSLLSPSCPSFYQLIHCLSRPDVITAEAEGFVVFSAVPYPQHLAHIHRFSE